MDKYIVASELSKIARLIKSGGDSFYHYVKGSDPKRLFKSLVDNARYESGSGGYSGTIAEKASNGFKIISEPLPRKAAEKLADDKISDNDKLGPAFAIPVLGRSQEKVIDVKPQKVLARNTQEAASIVLKSYEDKFKPRGIFVSWQGKPTVNVSKAPRWSLKQTFKGSPKPEVRFYITVDGSKFYDSSLLADVSSLSEAKDLLKKVMDLITSKGRSMPREVGIGSYGEMQHVAKYKIEAKGKGPQFEVSGKILTEKVSKNIEGYFFFGIASS